MTTASEVIYDVVDPEANIIVGAVVDERLEGEIHVTVIATGFEGGGSYRPERALGSFLSNASGDSEPAGAAIPSFLLNRRQG
jgi:cell division protein FtsZ